MKDLSEITFEERITTTLDQLYYRWSIASGDFFAEEYVKIFQALPRWLDYVERIEFEFDCCRGFAEVVMKEDYFEYEHKKQIMRHVVQSLERTYEEAKDCKVYRRNGKKRNSRIFTESDISKSGWTVEYFFWDIFEGNLAGLKRRYYAKKTDDEISIQDELEEFYNEVLGEFMRKVVKCYSNDLSIENFIEQLPEYYPEVWEQVKGQFNEA